MANSIGAQSGRGFLLKAGDVAVSPPDYQTVGGLRSVELTVNGNPVDISNVAGNGYQEWDPDGGLFQVTVSCSGIFDSTTTGAQTINSAAMDRTLVACNVVSDHGDQFFFDGAIQDFTRSGTHDGPEEFSFTIVSHNNVQYVAA